MSNHAPVTYDKWNNSMIEQVGGMEFWTLRPDLSRNMPTVEGADINGEQPNFITIYYYGVQQGGNANTEAVFSRFNEIAIQSDSARPWVAMTKTLGGNISVYSYSTPHMTMSEVLAPAQAEFATVLAQMYSEDSDLDTKVRNGWVWRAWYPSNEEEKEKWSANYPISEFIDENLDTTKIYYYKLSSVNSDGEESQFSSEYQIQPVTFINAPPVLSKILAILLMF